MPAFHPLHDAYLASDYPPQCQLRCEGPVDYRTSYEALRSTATSQLDLQHPDPYNYGKHASAIPSAYQLYDGYANESFSIPHQLGAPMVQPLQIDNNYTSQHAGYGGARNYPQATYDGRHTQEEKVVGGVSAQLDYEMEQMTSFVVEMASGIVKPPVCEQPLFRKWVLQVLNATRLPSATIVLSLSYLALRVRRLSATGCFVPSERGLYQMLTVSLILGSKFLDDNTFQNKSWAEVSNISVHDLNKDEISWLESFGHRLHFDPNMSDGFSSWQKQWENFKSRPNMSTANLRPLDTGLRTTRPGRQSISPSQLSQQFSACATPTVSLEASHTQASYAPNYSPYESWYSRQSTQGSSPSTAPHTGPTTPDYYSTTWGQGRAYSARDASYDFATLPHFTTSFGSAYESQQAYDYTLRSMWNCHGQTCQCSNCRQTEVMPRYGPITAA